MDEFRESVAQKRRNNCGDGYIGSYELLFVGEYWMEDEANRRKLIRLIFIRRQWELLSLRKKFHSCGFSVRYRSMLVYGTSIKETETANRGKVWQESEQKWLNSQACTMWIQRYNQKIKCNESIRSQTKQINNNKKITVYIHTSAIYWELNEFVPLDIFTLRILQYVHMTFQPYLNMSFNATLSSSGIIHSL